MYVRKSDWQEAVNEHKRIHLLGGPAPEAYIKEKQAVADILPAKVEVSSLITPPINVRRLTGAAVSCARRC